MSERTSERTIDQATGGTPPAPTTSRRRGLTVRRVFTEAGADPFASVEWSRRTSRIANPDGSVVFEMKDAEVPAGWSQVAADIMVSKYFRKAGVPQTGDDGSPVLDDDGRAVTGPERSAKQVVSRLASTWRWWGEEHGYFATPADAQAFQDELSHMLVHQMAAPNSPQWFNTGLAHAYGITGPAQGHYATDPRTGEMTDAHDAYTRPQVSACFIQSVEDDLVGEGGIMDLWVREARLFKFGSGTGTNYSAIRGEGEQLSGGGTSSGLMSFLKVGDRAAGAIKSGGTTRRAAKMVCLNVDHPDIERFISWKADEEKKVAALIAAGYPADYNGEAYATVSGQNANNTVRVTNDFVKAVEQDADWNLTRRTDGSVHKTVKARDLWRQIAEAAWACADPGLHYDTTINEWHTSPADGRINASNPCVTGDTLVATISGLRRIDSLVGTSVEVVAGDGRPSVVTSVFPTGVKDVYRLRTAAGFSLRLTADHKVFTTNRGDVPASELTVGDRVQLQGAGFGVRTLGREIAEVLGVAVGDGCQTGEQGQIFITVGKSERAVAERVLAGVAAFTADSVDGRSRRARTVVETPTSLRIGTSSAPMRALVSRYTVIDRGSAEKRFTDDVYELDRASQAALLRGLFTADGTVADYGEKSQYVSLDSVALPLLEQVQLMLLSFGVKAKIYRDRLAAGMQEMPGGTYQRQTMHSLRISRGSRVVFEREVGFMPESAKATKLAAMNARVSTYAERMDDAVASVELVGTEPVYDLTEPRTSHFVANGLVVHNCSEYLFLDNTACNLASLNLIKFVDVETGQVDLEAYRHAVRLWTVVLEISVMMAGYPSEEIARRSYDFRTLGLGYANIGTVLMIRGLPYDSDAARAFTGAMTAIMTGESYATSAEMAKHLGPFASYPANERHMLRVIRNHRRAAYDAPVAEYEGLSVPPMGLDPELAPDDLVQAAREAWDRALAGGELFGYRNAQTTLLAPTGTIGLLMDCDTTGVEPDFALVKFKKLAGGGYFKIANQSIPPALKNLGYSQDEIAAIMTYVLGTLSLDGAPHVHRESLTAKGFTAEDLAKVEAALPSVFELGFAFNAWTLGEEALARVGVSMADASAPGFDLLRALGFSRDQVAQANERICGTMTVEGAPQLRPEHLPVFDTANKCGTKGTRYIHHMGHIKMMAIAQSFLSGAISKTINMPSEATVEDIVEAYMESWGHGIKAMALYRDGSKMSQPLSTKSGSDDEDEAGLSRAEVDELVAIAVADAVAAATRDAEAAVAVAKQAAAEEALATARSAQDEAVAAAVATAVEEARSLWEADLIDDAETITAAVAPDATGVGARLIAPAPAAVSAAEAPTASPVAYAPAPVAVSSADDLNRAHRRRLPGKRRGFTQEGRVAGQKVFLRTGEYADGTLGEVFIDVAKEGAAFRSMINCFAISISKGLQYGVPLEEYVDTFTFVRFEPQGMVTGHPNIRMATSMIDYVFRVLAFEYLGRTDLVQVAPELTEPAADAASTPVPAASAAFPNWDGPRRTSTPAQVGAGATTPAVGEPLAGSRASMSGSVDGLLIDARPTTTPATPPAADRIGTATALVEEAADHDARVLPPSGSMDRAEETVPVVTIVHDIPRSPLPGSNGNGHANGSSNGHLGSGHAHPNGNGAYATQAKAQPLATQAPSALDLSLGSMMGDAPFCDVCGHITVRNGACYKCLNCGNSLGCS